MFEAVALLLHNAFSCLCMDFSIASFTCQCHCHIQRQRGDGERDAQSSAIPFPAYPAHLSTGKLYAYFAYHACILCV